ncbi:hypothetical protein C4585_02225 [Candidatus Parcubacteria bacterium]|nr:MAG: hypothetical protein C4585_02225 [Candidatus Parcubacteria bacterium]
MKLLLVFLSIFAISVVTFFVFNPYIYTEEKTDTRQFDGAHFGFVHAFTDNNTAMDFDDAVWLTGTVAEDAAIRAGICTEETRMECLPNDFFIENSEKKSERLAIHPDVTVVMQTWNMEETGGVRNQEISLTHFANLINDPTLHWRNLPYRITVVGDEVTRIEEVYVP